MSTKFIISTTTNSKELSTKLPSKGKLLKYANIVIAADTVAVIESDLYNWAMIAIPLVIILITKETILFANLVWSMRGHQPGITNNWSTAS